MGSIFIRRLPANPPVGVAGADGRQSPRSIFNLNSAVFVPGRVRTAGARNGPTSGGIRPPEHRGIQFACTVPAAMRNAVEGLFFFNPRQQDMIEQIRTMVESTGVPSILERDKRIWIGVPSGDMQCLFACAPTAKPVAVVLYSRPAADLLVISHLAVDPDCAGSADGEPDLATRMVNKVAEIARSIKGVTRVQLPYRRASFVRVGGRDQ